MASRPPFGKPPFPVPPFGSSMPPLRMPSSGPTIGPADSVITYQREISMSANAAGISKADVDEFFKWWATSQMPVVKMVLGGIKSADGVIKFAKFFFALKKWGFAVAEITRIFILVCGLRAPQILPLIESVLRNGQKLEAGLKRTGGVRNALGLILLGVNVYNNLNNSEYSEAAAKTYKFAMGKAVPWASVIDTIQSFLPVPTAKSAIFFKILRACDPIGLGAVAVDSFVIMVQAIIDWAMGNQFNEERLGKLVARMKSGPTSLFAELGENAGDALFDIMQMDAQDWRQLGQYSWSELSDFLTGTGEKGKRRGGATGTW